MKSKFKYLEIILLLFSFFLMSFSLTLFFMGIPIRNYIFDLSDPFHKNVIGFVSSQNGSVKRQSIGESDFSVLKSKEKIYHFDVILTGNNSNTTLEFKNGSSITLDPNTMVRLSFLENILWKGKDLVQEVEVASGSVTTKTAGDSIRIKNKNQEFIIYPHSRKKIEEEILPVANQKVTPTPIVDFNSSESLQKKAISTQTEEKDKKIQNQTLKSIEKKKQKPVLKISQLRDPAHENPSTEIKEPPPTLPFTLPSSEPILPQEDVIHFLKVQIDHRGSYDEGRALLRKKVNLFWKTLQPEVSFIVKIFQFSEAGKIKIFEKLMTSQKYEAAIGFFANQPGTYYWSIENSEHQPIVSSKNSGGEFVVSQDLESIKVLSPLIAGQNISSSQLSGRVLKNFDVTLRWEKDKAISEYIIHFLSDPNAKKSYFEKKVNQEEYTFKQKKLAGKIFYRIDASSFTKGYRLTSGIQKFDFNFSSPLQNLPVQDAFFSLKILKEKEKGRVLLTWQKTNFTQQYELEISSTSDFKNIILSKKIKDNFHFLDIQKPGNFFWRVRSYGAGIVSPMSGTFHFRVDP